MGALILLLNAALGLAFLLLLGRKAWPAASRMLARLTRLPSGRRE